MKLQGKLSTCWGVGRGGREIGEMCPRCPTNIVLGMYDVDERVDRRVREIERTRIRVRESDTSIRTSEATFVGGVS